MTRALRIGSRVSEVATAQAGRLAGAIMAATGLPVDLVPIHAEGDLLSTAPSALGDAGVFVGRLRMALIAGQCDLLVHTASDLPAEDTPGVALAAVPRRGETREALVARDGLRLRGLPKRARVGVGWPRQAAALAALRGDLEVIEIRGHVDERIALVEAGEFDAVVVAANGLAELDRTEALTERFAPDRLPPAVGQGALAVEAREDTLDEAPVAAALAAIHHEPSLLGLLAERTAAAALRADPLLPVGFWSEVGTGGITVHAAAYPAAGPVRLEHAVAWPARQSIAARRTAAAAAGRALAKALREAGVRPAARRRS